MLAKLPAQRKHGTVRKYTKDGCRCEECRAAHTKYHREWTYKVGLAQPKVEAAKILRYIECLHGFGLRRENIAQAAKIHPATTYPRSKMMQQDTARRIEGLHWGLHYRHGPFRRHCKCSHDLVVLQSFEEVTA